jgi:hypothetical protein
VQRESEVTEETEIVPRDAKRDEPAAGPPAERLEDDVCVHIFTVSAALVGACLTVVGFFRALGRAAQEATIGDNLVALDALVFLAACVLAYIAIRTRRHRRRYTIERLADILFLCALAFMAVICGLIAYEVI